MTVFVDALMDWGWRLGVSCHMLPQDHTDLAVEELHQLAESIGLKRDWFQTKTRWLHYDLTASRRALALRAGAVEVSTKEYIIRMRHEATQMHRHRL